MNSASSAEIASPLRLLLSRIRSALYSFFNLFSSGEDFSPIVLASDLEIEGFPHFRCLLRSVPCLRIVPSPSYPLCSFHVCSYLQRFLRVHGVGKEGQQKEMLVDFCFAFGNRIHTSNSAPIFSISASPIKVDK